MSAPWAGHRHLYEALDRSLKALRECEKPFGGLTAVLAGDWKQALPVIRKGSRGQIVHACLKRSILWADTVPLSLTMNMRAQLGGGDLEFTNFLIRCGEGKLPILSQKGQFTIKIPKKYHLDGTLDDLINWTFEGIRDIQLESDSGWIAARGIICPTNKGVDYINNAVMQMFPGDEVLYRGYDSVDEDAHLYPTEFLNSLLPSGFPPNKLTLKLGCPIMLLRNLEPARGHCNGTKYIVQRLHTNIIEAAIADGAFRGNTILIPRIPMKPTDNVFPFELTRKQFPVRPSFGLTANKSQGQTLAKVGIYAETPFFSHGQLYVAASRVGHGEKLKIMCGNNNGETDNVVYREIL